MGNRDSSIQNDKLAASNFRSGLLNFDAPPVRPDPCDKELSRAACVTPQGAFPNYGESPASTHQCPHGRDITFLIASKFRIPEACASLGEPEVATFVMPMPEAAMHEYNSTPLGKDNIRLTNKPIRVQAVPKTCPPEVPAHSPLGKGVLPSDACH